MKIQITKNSDVREEKKISASGPQNLLRGKFTFGLDRQKKIFWTFVFNKGVSKNSENLPDYYKRDMGFQKKSISSRSEKVDFFESFGFSDSAS